MKHKVKIEKEINDQCMSCDDVRLLIYKGILQPESELKDGDGLRRLAMYANNPAVPYALLPDKPEPKRLTTLDEVLACERVRVTYKKCKISPSSNTYCRAVGYTLNELAAIDFALRMQAAETPGWGVFEATGEDE